MSWTDAKIEKLKKLWKKGLTTVEIGRELGISKNAVVGKAHRLKLESRPSPIKKADSKKTAKTSLKKADKTVKTSKKSEVKTVVEKVSNKKKTETQSDETLITLMDVKANSCRWPIGDPKDADFHFCDKEIVEGRPYCLVHCAQAYIGVNKLLRGAKQG